MNNLYKIMAIIAILSLPFCKSNKDDPDPIPTPPMEQDPAGITYSQQDDSPLSDTITLTEEDSNSNMVEYAIVLNSQPTENVEIQITLPSDAPSNLSISSGSQDESGAGSSITLTFTDANWDTSQMVTLTLMDDDISSSINGNLAHIVTSNDNNYNNLNKTIQLQLRDSEAGVLYQKNGASLPEIIELTKGMDSEYSYMIELVRQPTAPVEIEINLNNAPDDLRIDENGTPTTSISITFAVDEWDMPQTINLTFADNDTLSGPIMSTLTHIISSPGDPDSGYNMVPNKNLILHLIDDESPCDQPGANAEDDFTPNIDGEDYGAGTEDDPYIICNAMQLQAMGSSDSHLGAHYILGKDIDASSITAEYTCPAGTTGTCTGFQPIGRDRRNRFTGTLDGKGFIISNLTININLTSGESYAGLFGNASGANIRNIGLLNINVSSSASSGTSYAGGLVGETINSSSITNSYSTGNVSSSALGIFSFTSILSYAGGLVGLNSSSSIISSYSTGNVSSSGSSFVSSLAGGLVGVNSGSSIINSYSTGNVSSSDTSSHASSGSSSAGGLVGGNNFLSSITNSYSTGNVSSFANFSSSSAGGLLGGNNNSSIINSYSTGNVSSSAADPTFSRSFAGGLIALNKSNGSIINSYSTGNVSSSAASSSAGGLLGRNINSSIINSYFDQNATTLFENGSEVSDTAVDSNTGTLTCLGGLSTSPPNPGDPSFTTSTSTDTGTCDDVSPTIFFNWQTLFDIDNADMDDDPTTGTDESSVRYDSNNDGSVTDTDAFLWNFGTMSEYPIIASIPGTVDEQAVTMASGFLRFSNTIIGEPSATDPVFFYDIDDAAMDITTSGTEVQGTTAGSYAIEDAVDADGDALTGTDLPTVNASGVITLPASFASGSEFYLKVTFTKGTTPMASYTRRYRFKK